MPLVEPTTSTRLRNVSPYLIVDAVVQSAEYYRDRLGFQFHRYWGEPPCFVMVERDGVQFMLRSLGEPGHCRPNRAVHADTRWQAYVYVSDVDALYDELRSRGAKIVQEPYVTDYGCKEIEVEDPNGYILCFGQDLEPRA